MKSMDNMQIYDWKKVSWDSENFSASKSIYLSSLEDVNLFNFYRYFSDRIRILIASSSNIPSEDSLLIYAEDVSCQCDKISVHELWDKLYTKKLDHLLKFCYFDTNISPLKARELSACKLVQKFDDGAFSVAIVDDAENFIGTVTRADFSNNFPRKNYGLQRHLSLEASSDESEMKITMAKEFLTTGIREIPVLRNGKVISSCKLGNTMLLRNREENFPPVYWDIISDDVAKDFFESRRRILISSNLGALKGFYERFKNLADISIFDDPPEKFLNDDFDFLVYCADVWENFPIIKFNAQKLYANMLAEELHRYFIRHGIKYFYIEAPEKFSHDNKFRCKYSHRMATSMLTFGSPENDYLVHSDQTGQRWNTFGGMRLTPNSPQNYEHQIYIFGACSVIGTFVDDDHTIAAFLQSKFNEISAPYKVINAGNNGGFSGATINELYRMADAVFHSGDIVVHVNGEAWCYTFKDNLTDKISIQEIFNSSGNKFSRPFRDIKSGHHLNEDGNEIIADFLCRRILSQPAQKVHKAGNLQPLFTVIPVADRLIKSVQLKNFLTMLEKEKVSAKNSGAIVMNCNPFTLGHRYLIEAALREVDFLYVFVVEEDRSEFSFEDRFSLVKAGCSDLDNIKILPSGEYMISMTTFRDYFQKEAVQKSVAVAPVADIKLFAQTIAPLLGIKKRFAGTEPFDTLTATYNRAMAEILPSFGIEFIEVPRLTTEDGEIISASTVRDLMKHGRLQECRKFLPATTWERIK